MIKNLTYLLTGLFLLSSCKNKEIKALTKDATPLITNNGEIISFPDNDNASIFKIENVNSNHVTTNFTALGKVAATVLPSGQGASQNIILFDNPDLAGNYMQLIQHQLNISQIQNINIKQKQLELERTKDLHLHGAATGQDLLNAEIALSMEQTNLAVEKTALIEHETKLKSGGFNPKVLRNAKVGTAFVICDIPENQINKIKENQSCTISFPAFPNESFTGKIEAIADIVDNASRMIKMRISIVNTTNKLKSGMFTNVSFDLNPYVADGQNENFINISKTSLVTVQGKHYVFLKKSSSEFERREIKIGQQIGDRLIVYNGLKNGDKIAIDGVMQLKGLSFGY